MRRRGQISRGWLLRVDLIGIDFLYRCYMIPRMTPMAPIQRDWFDWTNFGVGTFGLILTCLAFLAATGAKRAAERAERSVQRHNAEGDFHSLARLAKDIHGYVENGSLREARLRTSDLRSELAAALGRHKPFLGRLAVLESKQLALKLVADGLNPASAPLTNPERIRLLKITGAILEELSGQWGDLRFAAEKGASDE